MPTIREVLYAAYQSLKPLSDTAHMDADLLLAHVLKTTRTFLFTYPEQPLSPEALTDFEVLLQKRIAGWPIAYLTGHRAFWTLDLLVSPNTLIPREDTELLVQCVLAKTTSVPMQILDLGTGSGAIAIAIASECPAGDITAIDRSIDALQIAQENARRAHCQNISFICSDWFRHLPTGSLFDIIVSNPPYLAEHDPHCKQGDLRYEPITALVSGPTGLEAFAHIIQAARRFLKPSGWLCLEHGAEQQPAVQKLLQQHGYQHIECHQDLQGHPRVTAAMTKQSCFSMDNRRE